MRKCLTRAIAASAMALGLALGTAGVAAADDAVAPAPYPSVQEQQAIFIAGGENAGKGAAQMVSAAWIGIPAQGLQFVNTAAGG